MRFQAKYKIFPLQYKNRRLDIPLRLLKFNRTKWAALLFFIKRRRRLSLFLYSKHKKKLKDLKNTWLRLKQQKINSVISRISFNTSKIQLPLKRWERFASVSKRCLAMRRSYSQLYDINIPYKQIKRFIFRPKNIDDKIELLLSAAQFEFRIDILLWRLRFFKTTHEARSFINRGLIKVNFTQVKGNYFLKFGDIISFNGNLDFFFNLNRLKKTFLDSTFVEIDFFTNTLIVVDSFENKSLLKNSFFMKQYFNLDLFYSSFR